MTYKVFWDCKGGSTQGTLGFWDPFYFDIYILKPLWAILHVRKPIKMIL